MKTILPLIFCSVLLIAGCSESKPGCTQCGLEGDACTGLICGAGKCTPCNCSHDKCICPGGKADPHENAEKK